MQEVSISSSRKSALLLRACNLLLGCVSTASMHSDEEIALQNDVCFEEHHKNKVDLSSTLGLQPLQSNTRLLPLLSSLSFLI